MEESIEDQVRRIIRNISPNILDPDGMEFEFDYVAEIVAQVVKEEREAARNNISKEEK